MSSLNMSSTSETDISDVDEDRQALVASLLEEISQKDKDEADKGQMSIEEMVNSHLNRFFESVRSFVGDVNQELPHFGPVTCGETGAYPSEDEDDEEYEEDVEENIQALRDICEDDLDKDVTASIEDLLKNLDFVASLDLVNDDGEQSLKELVDTLKIRIENFATKSSASQAQVILPSTESTLPPDEELLNSEEFATFFKFILDVSRTEMKDIFEGEDDLTSTKEFEGICLEVFKKVKLGTLDTCDEIAGPKFTLCPVKDTQDEDEVTDEECQKFWNSLHIRSYHKCVENNLEESELVEPLHRLLMIGKFPSTKGSRVKTAYDVGVRTIRKDLLDDVSRLTGALIIFENFFFHVVEGCAQAVDNLIKASAEFVENCILENVKVIETVFEIPNRYYQYWASVCVKREERPLVSKTRTSDHAELLRKVKEFRERMRIIASYIQTVHFNDFESKIQLLIPLTILPEESDLSYLFEEEFFLTAHQYVDKYFKQQLFVASEEYECPPVRKYEICQ